MADVLTRIVDYKRGEVAAARARPDAGAMPQRARDADPVRPFAGALAAAAGTGRPALIAEIKKASPSKGLIRSEFDPPALAKAYADGGATALSVLTDTPSFQGAPEFLVQARAATRLPCLRKDFMVDPFQVTEARAWGADAILIIMACTDDTLANELYSAAAEWGMDALFEVHDEAELERALALGPKVLGVNNRNLKTFETSLTVFERLAPAAANADQPALLVAESGIAGPADIARLQAAGASAFLVGESLMRQDDVAAATAQLLSPKEAAASASGDGLTHISADGSARMVEVGDKTVTKRSAAATAQVHLAPATFARLMRGDVPKGDVWATARIAGIMAAKRTHELIPLCHPLALSGVSVMFESDEPSGIVTIEATVTCTGKTGVEMEALTAASVAALTIYDMLKAVERGITIGPVQLAAKSGGASGAWLRS